jgi:hypothetical protein
MDITINDVYSETFSNHMIIYYPLPRNIVPRQLSIHNNITMKVCNSGQKRRYAAPQRLELGVKVLETWG